jgi:hypothetical protein
MLSRSVIQPAYSYHAGRLKLPRRGHFFTAKSVKSVVKLMTDDNAFSAAAASSSAPIDPDRKRQRLRQNAVWLCELFKNGIMMAIGYLDHLPRMAARATLPRIRVIDVSVRAARQNRRR